MVGAALAAALVPSAPGVAAAAPRSPLDVLPAGAAPTSVPYAIGTSVYFRGHVTDVRSRFPGVLIKPTGRQLTTVMGGAGYAWPQLTGLSVDLGHYVGRIGPRGGWTGFHASSGTWSRVAVTTNGAVAMPEEGRLYRADGRLITSFTGTPTSTCPGYCAPEAAGPHVVMQLTDDVMTGTPRHTAWLWSPPASPTRLPDGYRALGRLGAGWLGAPDGATCWRVAPAAAPTATRARICSQTLPLVSADGTRAAVVQAGRVRVVDTRTAAGVSLARFALPRWAPTQGSNASYPAAYAVPAAWESADSYLVVARDDTVLALVRCSVRTGRCERAVRSAVRTGVDRIVTERGLEDVTR